MKSGLFFSFLVLVFELTLFEQGVWVVDDLMYTYVIGKMYVNLYICRAEESTL